MPTSLQASAVPALPTVPPAGRRPVFVVLGMHRSGTSLLSNVLHFLGIDMADATDQVSSANAGGFWERPQLNAIQDRVLEALGRPIGAAAHSLPFPPGWWRRKEIRPFRQELVDYVSTELAESRAPWGFKDPRTVRLLPLWKEVFAELDLEPRFICAIRAPEEAGASMAVKNRAMRTLSAQQGELMWLAYNYDMLRYTQDISSGMVVYDRWFEDPVGVAEGIVAKLGLSPPMTGSEFESCVTGIVDRDLRRQHAPEKRTRGRSVTEALYAIMAAPSDEGRRKLVQHLAIIEMIFRTMEPLVPLLDELPDLRIAASALNTTTEALEAAREAQSRSAATLEEQSERYRELSRHHQATLAKVVQGRREAKAEADRHLSQARTELVEAQRSLRQTTKDAAVNLAEIRAETKTRMRAATEAATVLKQKLAAAREHAAAQDQAIAELKSEVRSLASERSAAAAELRRAKKDRGAAVAEITRIAKEKAREADARVLKMKLEIERLRAIN